MGFLFLAALVLAWPTVGLSLVAYIALYAARSYLRAKRKMEGIDQRVNFKTVVEPYFRGQLAEFFLALEVPTIFGDKLTQEEARECMKHVIYYLADNPTEAALFMRALEEYRAKSGEAVLDPISAALYERRQGVKGDMHRITYRAIATITAKNPSLQCFSKVDAS